MNHLFASLAKRSVTFLSLLLLTSILAVKSNNLFAQEQADYTVSLDADGLATLDLSDLEVDCFDSEPTITCTPSKAIGDGHALWLSNNIFPGSSTDFLFEAGAELVRKPDGTATIFGTLFNVNNPTTDRWEVKLYLAEKKNWSEWSALGRSYKDEKNLAGNEYLNWDYYIEDTQKVSELVGIGDNTGKSLEIIHMPSNYRYGFQVGTAANSKNASFGMSGWFSYTWDGDKYYQGDFNLDLSNCIEENP